MQKNCERCGSAFTTERPLRARFCSDRCRKATKRAQETTAEVERREAGAPRLVETPTGAPLAVEAGLRDRVAAYLEHLAESPQKAEAVLIAGRLEALDDSAAGVAALSRRLGELLAGLVAPPAPTTIVGEDVKAALRGVETIMAAGSLFEDMSLASLAGDEAWLELQEAREALDYDDEGRRRWPDDGAAPVWLQRVRLGIPRGVGGDVVRARLAEAVEAGFLPVPIMG